MFDAIEQSNESAIAARHRWLCNKWNRSRRIGHPVIATASGEEIPGRTLGPAEIIDGEAKVRVEAIGEGTYIFGPVRLADVRPLSRIDEGV